MEPRATHRARSPWRRLAPCLLGALATSCGSGASATADAAAGTSGVCEVGTVECVPGTPRSRIECDGFTWREIAPCAPDLACHLGQCVPCKPGTRRCFEDGRIEVCDAGGQGFAAGPDCAPGQVCDPETAICRNTHCEAGAERCADLFNLEVCDTLGLAWGPGPACAEDAVCYQGKCLSAQCDPSILLLLDASGSMGGHWPALTELVEGILDRHAARRVGLQTFPSDGGCGTRIPPLAPMARENAGAIRQAMDGLAPEGGTPIAAQLDVLRRNFLRTFPSTFGNVVVLLTDGEDTCSGGATEAIEALVDHADVDVYVVGFQYAGDSATLDAMAAAGGTSHREALTPQSFEELEAAFDRILDDIKVCF